MTTVFGTVAETYQDIRPGYPISLADDIKRYHGRPPRTVAEIGAGTGKGTQVLLALGGELTCIEPDPRMAASLPPSAEVFIGTFEDWVAPQGGVDVLACALAWHWADEGTRIGRAIDALAPGGTLAIFGHQYAYVHPEHFAGIDATFKALDRAHGRGEAGPPSQFWFYDEIADSGRFERVRCHTTHRDHPMTSDEYVRLVSTFSPFLLRTPGPAGGGRGRSSLHSGRFRRHTPARPADHAGAGDPAQHLCLGITAGSNYEGG